MNYDNILEQLTTACPFEQIFKDTITPDGSSYAVPRKKIGHLRADHDGWRWWYTYWPCHGSLATPEVLHEAASVYHALIADDALRDLPTLTHFCGTHPEAQVNHADDEFNFYLVGDVCHYWVRLITRFKDYNIYLNFYSRDPMEKYFDYLERLQQSGETNMYGAVPYLQKEFPELSFDPERAREILLAWIGSFSSKEDDAT